jgi:hypothetical protein
MNGKILLGLGVLWGVAAHAADAIQPLDVKVGLWEVTGTNAVSGLPPIPQDVLDKMPPERRAKLEAVMKERSGQGPKTTTRKHCVTKEELEKSAVLGEDSKSCTRTVVTSTRRKLDARISCVEEGNRRAGTFDLEAADREHVKGSMRMVVTGGDKTMTVTSTFTGKWIGPACEKGD